MIPVAMTIIDMTPDGIAGRFNCNVNCPRVVMMLTFVPVSDGKLLLINWTGNQIQ